jgi:putative peptidoglycan lipid II flippase
VMTFLKRFGPATIGSAGTQIALFADTIIASFLATGALSALYYADRLNQLPIGVIGIAAGTVLLPEMARRIAKGDEGGAHHSQNRAIELTLLLSVPCLVAFLVAPDLIMRGLFNRGAFTTADAHAAAMTLMAYAIGLLPFVLVRSVSAAFLARGDTATPVKALFAGVIVNVALKVLLMSHYAQVGLAFATSVGAWINLLLLAWLSARQGFLVIDSRLRRSGLKFAVAGAVLGAGLLLAKWLLGAVFAGWTLRNEMTLLALGVVGAVIYGGAIGGLFHRDWRTLLRGRAGTGP